ncbi:MAG TPA: hypothetical protein VLK84_16140 [Longimicrobium sp.]|nr:hypothetical protein [Longimicrobium sp.]
MLAESRGAAADHLIASFLHYTFDRCPQRDSLPEFWPPPRAGFYCNQDEAVLHASSARERR